jgi:hypothetical protein
MSTRPARRSKEGRLAPGDSPAVPAALAGVGGLGFVLARLLGVAHGDVTRFVFAGDRFVNRSKAPKGLHVFPGSGYDGQFYYRLALDPLDLAHRAYGITFDSDFRAGRIGYSALTWLVSGGRAALVPWAEVIVNLAALCALGFLGGLLAHEAGRHAAWGLLFPAFWGFLFSIGRDLPEVVAGAFLLAGLVSLRRCRWLTGGLLLAAAALTLETTLDVVLGFAVVSIGQLVVRRRRMGRQDLGWVVPGAAFAAWQGFGWAETGALPLRSGARDNLSVPVVNVLGAFGHYLAGLPSAGSWIWLGEFGLLALVTVMAAWSVGRSTLLPWERLAWGISLLVAVSLSSGIWDGRADFRGFEDLYLLSVLVLVGSLRRLTVLAVLVGAMWVATFAHRAIRL